MPAPTYLDLKAFLKGRGIDICNDLSKLDYQAAIEKAEDDLMEGTGWNPFLIGTSTTKTFDQMTGDPIWFPVGIQTLTAITINEITVSVDGVELRRRRHTHPYSGIDFGRAFVKPVSIALTGTFGMMADYTNPLKIAICAKAAYALYPTITGIEGEVKREKQGPVEYEYQAPMSQYEGKRGALLKLFDDAVQDWLRID